ncbi:4Fe-4S binding protein [Photobacterium sp. ZSDE20]|uniref:4Fe-4S binding protein n=1 Tax=Photobacterium pectinilyticum TaxID=2906793 RepID=A0ABT1N1H6_9GAMM|nr:4Fe-4S binding protein [Photobacterium sp. ZSDE20]MCQ1058583.1 4Fe-4S binding protein [Photobacterium sp. ZSDE20]MDD1826296.1 4Fe-4S binding protein [Photobacterium sp. ZSDE20]
MSLTITDKCTGCNACKLVCPNNAIYQGSEAVHYAVHPQRCNECSGQFEDQQCASICPIEEAIVDQYGKTLNPKGSLSPPPNTMFITI